MKTGVGSEDWRLESAKRRESGPPERRVVSVVSKSFPPTFSLMRSLVDSVEVLSSSIMQLTQLDDDDE